MHNKRGKLCYCMFLILIGILLPLNRLQAENDYPIIFVHGFLGWGSDEMGGYHYWGGDKDLVGYLDSLGYTVYEASVGPVSSNWDRAVELYYSIKGGQVDYGKTHADRYGIIQKPEGKAYPGLYPEWDSNHPVHIIGHSMGGQTARMLQFLLANDFYLDSGYSVPEESFLLGQSNLGWIKSITTFSTPHDGSTLTNLITTSIPFLQDIIAVAAVTGTNFYDFDLQQWNFKREKGERWLDYLERMRNHPAWGTKNISAWDSSLDGARELNTGLVADPDVYYFSYATASTRLDTNSGRHIPDPGMSLTYFANARLMGYRIAYWSNGTATDSTWFENDGIVNTISMKGPRSGLNGPDPIAVYHSDEPLIPGQWYFMGKLNYDHKQIIGHKLNSRRGWKPVRDIFRKQCEILWALPQ
ncbi:MAG: lipase [Candidatus Marinimicrobia bacterium]|nr:lipase [Candidatus Neomarinimicrobiota bacterium]